MSIFIHVYPLYLFSLQTMYMFEQVSFKLNILSCIKYGSMSIIDLRTNVQVYRTHISFRSGSPFCGQWRRLANAKHQWLFVQWIWIAHLIPFNSKYTVLSVVNFGPLLDSVLTVKYSWFKHILLNKKHIVNTNLQTVQAVDKNERWWSYKVLLQIYRSITLVVS